MNENNPALTWAEFERVELRVGTITRKSSVRITVHYTPSPSASCPMERDWSKDRCLPVPRYNCVWALPMMARSYEH